MKALIGSRIADSAIGFAARRSDFPRPHGGVLAPSRNVQLVTSQLVQDVIGCAIEVHSILGPGLLESMYERCLAHEFTLRGLRYREQVALPIGYKGLDVGVGYRADFVVEGELLLELKSVEKLQSIHDAQVMTYLRLLKIRQGLLINFNVPRLREGIRGLLNSRCA